LDDLVLLRDHQIDRHQACWQFHQQYKGKPYEKSSRPHPTPLVLHTINSPFTDSKRSPSLTLSNSFTTSNNKSVTYVNHRLRSNTVVEIAVNQTLVVVIVERYCAWCRNLLLRNLPPSSEDTNKHRIEHITHCQCPTQCETGFKMAPRAPISNLKAASLSAGQFSMLRLLYIRRRQA